MTPAEQVEAGCARQLADADRLVGLLRAGRRNDATQIRELWKRVRVFDAQVASLTAERDAAKAALETATKALEDVRALGGIGTAAQIAKRALEALDTPAATPEPVDMMAAVKKALAPRGSK